MTQDSGSPRPRRAELALVAAAGLLTPASALAQFAPVPGTPYQTQSESITYTPLSGATNITTDNDDGNFDVTLPFAFSYFEDSYTQLRLTTNGVMGFQPDIGTTSFSLSNTTPGSTGAPNNWIAPFWDDQRLYSQNNGWIAYKTEGTAPQRTFTLEWHNLSRFAATGVTFDMRVRLYEGPAGRFDVEYGTISGSGSFTATMAFEDKNGVAHRFRPCTNGCNQADFAALANTRLTFTKDPGVELLAVDLTPPQFVFQGAETPIRVVAQSLHGNPIGPFQVAVVADSSPAFANPVTVGRTAATTGPYQRLEAVVPARIGSDFTVGQRVYLRAVIDADAEVVEVDEGNNTIDGSEPILLLQGRPDVRIDRVSTSARTVDAGSSFDVFVEVSNAGGEPTGPVDLAGMLSSNPVISPSDGQLAATSIALAPGESTTATLTVTLPPETNSGAYFVGALADAADQLDELSESNNGLAAFRPIEVTGGPVTVLSAVLPAGQVDETYAAFIRVAGGSGSYRFGVASGQLPVGIGITPNGGELFGRPVEEGCETFTIGVTDAADPSATDQAELELCIQDPSEPLTVVTRALPTAQVGQEYDFLLVATGSEPDASLAWTALGALPEGFRLTEDGRVVGTGVTSSQTTFGVQVSDGISTASRDLELVVQQNGNLQIVTTPLPPAMVGRTYSAQLQASGGVQPITWLLVSGTAGNVGLDLAPDGLLSGIPERAGDFSLTVEARDAGGPGNSALDVNTFELRVSDDGELRISTESLPEGSVGAGYDRAIAAIGGVPPYTWTIAQGRLPEGLTARNDQTTNELRIVGTPEEQGASTILVTATDEEGRVARRAFGIDIGPRIVVEPPVDEGCRHVAARGGSAAPGAGLVLLLGLVLGGLRRRPRRR